MSEELKCPICGKPTAHIYGNYNKYGLCIEHSKQEKAGEIEQCPDCGKWNKKGTVCTCQNPWNKNKEDPKNNSEETTCIICGAKTKKGYFCKVCYYEMLEYYDELDYLNSFYETKEYYYNLKNNIFWVNNLEYAKEACKKLFALAKTMGDYKNGNFEETAAKDITYLLNKKLEFFNKKNAENEEKNIQEHDDLQNVSEEIADYRRVYPATVHCNDGHYVRSSNEKTIDDQLYKMRVFHEYEKRYKALDGNIYFPDFYLPDYDLFIEYFGVEKNKDKNEHKKEIFLQDKSHNFEFINNNKQGILDEVIEDIVEEYKRKKQK